MKISPSACIAWKPVNSPTLLTRGIVQRMSEFTKRYEGQCLAMRERFMKWAIMKAVECREEEKKVKSNG